jgi:cytidylate kinase
MALYNPLCPQDLRKSPATLPKPHLIAIDGPVATGKSAVGRLVVRRLDYRFLDTGAMYRALTWLALQRGINVHDESALTNLAGIHLTFRVGNTTRSTTIRRLLP